MNASKILGRWGAVGGLLLAGMFLAGCQTGDPHFADPQGMTAPAAGNGTPVASPPNNSSPEVVNVGDALMIIFSDMPSGAAPQPFEVHVKEDGNITLLLNETFHAVGKRTGDLEKEIRARYVPAYYRYLTVTIKPQDRFYFVDGEVRAPGRQVYVGPMTATKAIGSCGDFTDFANKKKVKIIRVDGRIEKVNCKEVQEHPEKDLPIYPGDRIHVPRKWF